MTNWFAQKAAVRKPRRWTRLLQRTGEDPADFYVRGTKVSHILRGIEVQLVWSDTDLWQELTAHSRFPDG